MDVSAIGSASIIRPDASDGIHADQQSVGGFRQFVAAINQDQVNAENAMHQFHDRGKTTASNMSSRKW